MDVQQPPRGYLIATLGCYCPRCREGKLFKHSTSINIRRNMEMYTICLLCHQPTELEVGFYYGTSYVSYVFGVVLSICTFLIWWLLIGFSFNDNRFIYWVGFNSILLVSLQPWLMRFSRSLWISWFVSYNPDWRTTPPEDTERINASEMNNW
jgi:hypothetical protein